MTNRSKAHEIGWENSKNYDPNLSKECWAEMAAIDMGGWKDKCFNEVIEHLRETYQLDEQVMFILKLMESRYKIDYDKRGKSGRNMVRRLWTCTASRWKQFIRNIYNPL